MSSGSTTVIYQPSPHRLVIERACGRVECRDVMSARTTRELLRRGGRPSERAISVARDHARTGCERFVAGSPHEGSGPQLTGFAGS